MEKSVVLFSVEEKKYFTHKVVALLTKNINEATTYPDKSYAVRMLYENKESFKNKGLLKWKLETIYSI